MTFHSINPATGEVLNSYDTLSRSALLAKTQAAQKAACQLQRTTVEHRAMWMKKLAGILEHETEELAMLLTNETGKTINASRQEIRDCALCCRYFAQNVEALPRTESLQLQTKTCTVQWRSLGVVLGVLAANNPFWQAFRFLVPVLLAGNAALLRHAPTVSRCAIEVELLAVRAGFPREVFQTLLLDEKQLAAFVADKRLAAVVVNETVATGRSLAAKARSLMKTSLNERSSNPFLVMPSANLFAAIQAGVTARCQENGEAWAATSRFLVHEAVYDDFALLFAAAMEEVKVGNPAKEETNLGPLSSAQGLQALETQVGATVAAGARVLTGGQRMVSAGNYFEPTVLAGGKKARGRLKSFAGPVAILVKVRSVAEAIAVANEVPYSQGASVWTHEPADVEALVAGLACESVFVNTVVESDPLLALVSEGSTARTREIATTMLREYMAAKSSIVAETLEHGNVESALEDEVEVADVFVPGGFTAPDTAFEDEEKLYTVTGAFPAEVTPTAVAPMMAQIEAAQTVLTAEDSFAAALAAARLAAAEAMAGVSLVDAIPAAPKGTTAAAATPGAALAPEATDRMVTTAKKPPVARGARKKPAQAASAVPSAAFAQAQGLEDTPAAATPQPVRQVRSEPVLDSPSSDPRMLEATAALSDAQPFSIASAVTNDGRVAEIAAKTAQVSAGKKTFSLLPGRALEVARMMKAVAAAAPMAAAVAMQPAPGRVEPEPVVKRVAAFEALAAPMFRRLPAIEPDPVPAAPLSLQQLFDRALRNRPARAKNTATA